MRVYKIVSDHGAVDEWFAGEYIGYLNSWVKDDVDARLFTSRETAEMYIHAGRHRENAIVWDYAKIIAYDLVRVED